MSRTILYRGAVYREAMPYKTSPAIPSRLWHDAVKSDLFLRSLTSQDLASLVNAADYMSRTERDAETLLDELSKYHQRVPKGLQEQRDYYAKQSEAYDPVTWMGYYVGWLHSMVREAGLEYIKKTIEYWKESLDHYLGDYFVGGSVDLDNPTANIKNQEELEQHYEYSISILPAVTLVGKVLHAIQAIIAYIDNMENNHQYSVQYQREQYINRIEKIFPEGIEATEIMWHVTTAYSKIMRDGFKTKETLYEESGRPVGLGGGQDDRISFTTSYKHALGIQAAILDMIKLAKQPPTAEQLLARYRDLGLTESGIAEALGTYDSMWGKLPSGTMPFDRARNLYEYLQLQASKEGLEYFAAFWSPDQELYAGLDPKDVRIIEAVVDTADESITYHRAEEEFRVPVNSILAFGPVGSQQKRKLAGVTRRLWCQKCR